ncbi:MAG: DEAD/DEAH box helicase [Spirochaetaceae bacterium]|nr:DEAD/DEAH box helicase [Spirochaetaceae bacterium]
MFYDFHDRPAFRYRLTLKPVSTLEGGFFLSMDVLTADGKYLSLKEAAKAFSLAGVLQTPLALARYLPALQGLLNRVSIRISEDKMIAFLGSAAGLLKEQGIEVALPKVMKKQMKPKLVAVAKTREGGASAGNLVSSLNLPEILDWHWEVQLEGQTVSKEEFEDILSQKSRVVQFRGRYICIDPLELKELFKTAYKSWKAMQSIQESEAAEADKEGGKQEESAAQRLQTQEFIKAHLAGNSVLSVDARAVMERLFVDGQVSPASDQVGTQGGNPQDNWGDLKEMSAELHGRLRPYQQRGFNWVMSLFRAGFGCILADDMGLGKTIQAIAVMLRLKEMGLLHRSALIIAPAALLENWENELSRFAPSLRFSRYHGRGRVVCGTKDIYLTTYQTAAKDKEALSQIDFSLLLVDEAQNLKNANTQVARAVKSLHSQFKLALSGTPIENRLEDLRSIFDFIVPGYLGNESDFRRRWRIPIEVHREGEIAQSLQKITSPFLLRRLKSDKKIIADLPDKVIINNYASLEKEQAALYESLVRDSLERAEGIDKKAEAGENVAANRHALVLNLLTGLKQICNHPRAYDKESPALAKLSGKAQLLLTLLGTILENGEKTLIFSQYVETLAILQSIIKEEMGVEPLLYHGGMDTSKRGKVIDAFQNQDKQKIMLISLKAGGVGLNLTAASRVIHYDLWYNPSVENQATDRAFRIGQKRKVFVHRFITKSTFEEKIDAMLNNKLELAGMSLGTGESWLSQMTHEQLAELFG